MTYETEEIYSLLFESDKKQLDKIVNDIFNNILDANIIDGITSCFCEEILLGCDYRTTLIFALAFLKHPIEDERNTELAKRLLLSIKSDNRPEVLFALSEIYIASNNPQLFKLGIKYLEKSASQNYLCAIRHLAFLNLAPDLYPDADKDVALYLLHRSVSFGDANSCVLLASHYYDNQDFANAIFYANKALSLTDEFFPYATVILAKIYANLKSEYCDENKASMYVNDFIKNNQIDCIADILDFTITNGWIKNTKKALLHKADELAIQSDLIALHLFDLYETGKFLKKNSKLEKKYLKLALANNNIFAQVKLAYLLKDNKSDPSNEAKGFALLQYFKKYSQQQKEKQFFNKILHIYYQDISKQNAILSKQFLHEIENNPAKIIEFCELNKSN